MTKFKLCFSELEASFYIFPEPYMFNINKQLPTCPGYNINTSELFNFNISLDNTQKIQINISTLHWITKDSFEFNTNILNIKQHCPILKNIDLMAEIGKSIFQSYQSIKTQYNNSTQIIQETQNELSLKRNICNQLQREKAQIQSKLQVRSSNTTKNKTKQQLNM